jgi:hypothetical protein
MNAADIINISECLLYAIVAFGNPLCLSSGTSVHRSRTAEPGENNFLTGKNHHSMAVFEPALYNSSQCSKSVEMNYF